MNNISKIIESLITECECDLRIESGIFELHNTDHLVVLTERMEEMGIEEDAIEEFLMNNGVLEGKYPERQAYNKEGWLVTFPSKEYRDAAIKKRTHFTSDPTHGKGGMNLYYKKRGKQKRQKQQAPSVVDTPEIKPAALSKQKGEEPQTIARKRTPEQEKAYQDSLKKQKIPSAKRDMEFTNYIMSKQPKEPADKTTPDLEASAEPTSQIAQSPRVPAIDVPVVTTPPEQYATVSKKFAAQKRWTATEYGEYRDAEGNPVAVVGLSGEVVPIRSNDREEYKIFAEKSKA